MLRFRQATEYMYVAGQDQIKNNRTLLCPGRDAFSMQSRPSCSFLIRFKLVTTLIQQEQYSISCSCTARYHSINIFFQMRVRFFCYATSGARPSSAFVLAIHACLGHHHPTGSDRSLDTLPLHAATTIGLADKISLKVLLTDLL